MCWYNSLICQCGCRSDGTKLNQCDRAYWHRHICNIRSHWRNVIRINELCGADGCKLEDLVKNGWICCRCNTRHAPNDQYCFQFLPITRHPIMHHSACANCSYAPPLTRAEIIALQQAEQAQYAQSNQEIDRWGPLRCSGVVVMIGARRSVCSFGRLGQQGEDMMHMFDDFATTTSLNQHYIALFSCASVQATLFVCSDCFTLWSVHEARLSSDLLPYFRLFLLTNL